MFDQEIQAHLKETMDIIQLQAEIISDCTRTVVGGIKMHNQAQVISNLKRIKDSLRKLRLEFASIDFLLE